MNLLPTSIFLPLSTKGHFSLGMIVSDVVCHSLPRLAPCWPLAVLSLCMTLLGKALEAASGHASLELDPALFHLYNLGNHFLTCPLTSYLLSLCGLRQFL